MEHYTQKTNYADYLQLPTLLEAQKPLSDHPDELHFIIIHQIHELWFKLALHHLERARTAMQTDDLLEASRLIEQVINIFENARTTVENLHSLPPMAFHQFRELLAPGSGMQSFQFRELEFLVGLRDEQHINWVHRQLAKESHWEQVHRRLDEPSLQDALAEVFVRHHIQDVVDIYANPTQYPQLFQLCEDLSRFDHKILLWRQSHIQLVERTIGAGVMGTGGTTHEYLVATMRKPFFPQLWEARNALTRRINMQAKD